MPRVSTTWLTTTAKAMRECGVLGATKITRHKDGTVEEISLTLGPEPIRAPNYIPQEPTAETPESLAQARLDRRRQKYFDLRGFWPTDEQLKLMPESF